MTYEKLVRTYLREFQRACRDAEDSGATSIEMATRPQVHRFVDALVDMFKQPGADIAVHHDTHVTRESKPDWRLEDRKTFGVFCLGDHKSLDKSGPLTLSAKEDSQVQRYLELGRPVFVFDGIEFLYYEGPGSAPVRTSLVPKPLPSAGDWATLPVDVGSETLFRGLLENPGFRKWTERQLVEQLARRARLLARAVRPLLEAPAGSGSSNEEDRLIISLHELQGVVSEHHDRTLRHPDQCADFIAEVLTFGLFYVHTRLLEGSEDPEARRAKISAFWADDDSEEAEALRPFKAITDLLGDCLDMDGWLRDWYSDVTGLLAHAEYMGTEPGPQDFHALFEQFLVAFSPKVRFERGVFFTPIELTDWLVRTTNALSVQEFGNELATLAERIIDPCCGTGGFLESVVRHCTPSGDHVPLLVGFEVLPAPYALAHYRLAGATNGTVYANRTRVLLTDTLADNLLRTPELGTDGFSDELREACSLAQPPLRVVIGNPPSSIRRVGDAARLTIERQLADFRPPVRELSDRQNIQKALNNEAFRFLRWCAQRVLDSGRGIVALVLPGAFAQAVSFKYARRWLTRHFQAVYVLELDEDARAGGATHSLFQVQQGRMVLLAVLRGATPSGSSKGGTSPAASPVGEADLRSDDGGAVPTSASAPAVPVLAGGHPSITPQAAAHTGSVAAKVFHLSIAASTVAEKKSYLAASPDPGAFQALSVDEEPWLFAPAQSYPAKEWLQCWPLAKTGAHSGIFAEKCSGIKAAPAALLFHTSEPFLERRCKAIASGTGVTNNEMVDQWFSGQKKRPNANKLTPAVRASLGVVASSAALRKPYLFRPFLRGWLAESDGVWNALNDAPGGGTRSRPEVRRAFAKGAVGIAMAPAPKDVGETLTRFVTFAWDLPDNDIAARGNAMLYCDLYPKTNPKDGSHAICSNLTADVEALFAFAPNPSRSVLYYVFAVMSSAAYLETFEGVLFASSDPSAPPRIPIAFDETVRASLCALGERLAGYENFQTAVTLLPSLVAAWPSGVTEISLREFSYQEESLALTLIGENMNSVIISGVPARVMGTRIAGHPVIDKWLRERTSAYLRGTFKDSNAQDLLDVISRIERQHELLEKVDVEVTDLLTNGTFVPPAPLQ